MFLGVSPEGQQIPILLCLKCHDEAFGPDSWAKMCGTHPGTSGCDDSSNACWDGEFSYTEQGLGAKTYPHRRGPVLRLKYPIKELLESDMCGFCKVLKGLDMDQNLLTDRYETAGVDLQLFYPNRCNGILLPFVLQVSLRLERKREPTRETSIFLALTFDRSENHELESPLHNDNELSHPDRGNFEELTDTHGLVELQAWLQECETSHKECALSKQPRLPMRVLDVLVLNDTGRVKLLDTLERPQGRYIALSYVWGKKSSIRLVQATRNEFMRGIALDRLPKTLQDAVEVTQSLHVQYLWIDALCICQDSERDKEMQIPYMNEYYRDAVAVISASGASDVYAGFLQPQETTSDVLARAEGQIVADYPEYGSVPYRIPFTEPMDKDLALLTVDTKPRLYSYDEEPINKRGWTLQESALARRLLTFPSTGGIIMRCHDGEKLAGEILSNPFHEDPVFAFSDARDSSQGPEAETFENWTKIVQDYSRRSLSYPSDILVALGALALQTQIRDVSILGDYVAGLWSNTLRQGLLWHTASPPDPDRESYLPPCRTVSQYQAPSWSWASCGQPVTFRTEREPDLSLGNFEKEEPSWCIEILHCKVFPQLHRNPLGAVATSYIDIKGVLVPIRRVAKPDGCEVEDVALDTGDDRIYRSDESDLFAPDTIDSLALISSSSCYWLPLYDATRSRWRGLIVREIIPGRFCRLGFAEFDDFNREMLEEADKRIIRLN